MGGQGEAAGEAGGGGAVIFNGTLMTAGGFGFSPRSPFSNVAVIYQNGGLGGAGGGGYSAGGRGESGSGYTGGGGGGGAGSSFSIASDTLYSPEGGVAGGNGGSGALVSGTFSVQSGDTLVAYVASGGGGADGVGNGGNGWITLSVPEPSSASLLIAGTIGLLALSRRRKKTD
jgi:hypothetical protein